jgi:hypothetical protein
MSSFFYINNPKCTYIYRIKMVYRRRELAPGTKRFPLERQEDYKGTITFRPIKYTPPEIAGDAYASLRRRAGEGFINQFSNFDEGTIFATGLEGFQAGLEGEVAASLDPVPNDTETIVDPAQSTVLRDRGVILYLPTNIIINDVVEYNEFDLGAIGGIGLAGSQAGQGALSALARGTGQGLGSLAALLSGNVADQRGARLAASRLAQQGNAIVSGVVRAGTATTINPNSINIFKSVRLREFTFTFRLIANSAREAQEIEDIVKFFRTTMYPDTINFDPAGLNVPIGYEFPDKFEITMRYNNEPVAVKILPSVLRTVQTSLNNTAGIWYRDGKPAEVEIQLNFGEERTLNRNDIIEGY